MQFTQSMTDVVVSTLGQPPDPYHPKWCCPFHPDSNPSLIILPVTDRFSKERFYCRSCGEKGDAADFLARAKNIPLAVALSQLRASSSSSLGGGCNGKQWKEAYATFRGGFEIPLQWLFPPEDRRPMIGITADDREVEIHDTMHPGQRVCLYRLSLNAGMDQFRSWCYLDDVERETERWKLWKEEYDHNCLRCTFGIHPVYRKPWPETSPDELLRHAVTEPM